MPVVRISADKKWGPGLLGVSTDTKPTDVPAGTIFYELDSDTNYIFDGTSWSYWFGGPATSYDIFLLATLYVTSLASEHTLGDVKTAVETAVEQYATLLDTTASPVLYVGEALPGALTSAAFWRIKKVDTTTGVVVTWADGNSYFDNVWNNRATTIVYE